MFIDIMRGTRPNFIKIAPIIDAIKKLHFKNLEYRLIHTGQHYDHNMSKIFYQLNIPAPDYNLNAHASNQIDQISKIMIGYEFVEKNFDMCMVFGDINSTMACSIVAKKMQVKIAHVEAGIRSGDMSMPEEINRIVTDSLTDYFFTTSKFTKIKISLATVCQI